MCAAAVGPSKGTRNAHASDKNTSSDQGREAFFCSNDAKLSALHVVYLCRMARAMPNKIPPNGEPVNENADFLTVTPGTRFWITLIDATYEGPKEQAPEPEILWIEVHSLDKKISPLSKKEEGAVIAKILSKPHVTGRPMFRVSSSADSNQFLNIKIKAEYAQDTLGQAQGTGPYYTDSPRPDASEIPPYPNPREL